MYFLTATVDLVRISGLTGKVSATFLPAVHQPLSNMVEQKLYVTRDTGAMKKWEGFGIGYLLPQRTDEGGCYAETCAAIRVTILAERLPQIELDSHYADIMELCLYDPVPTGMGLDEKAFTYVNQLVSSDEDRSRRYEWFYCACCPPNVTEPLASSKVMSGAIPAEIRAL